MKKREKGQPRPLKKCNGCSQQFSKQGYHKHILDIVTSLKV